MSAFIVIVLLLVSAIAGAIRPEMKATHRLMERRASQFIHNYDRLQQAIERLPHHEHARNILGDIKRQYSLISEMHTDFQKLSQSLAQQEKTAEQMDKATRKEMQAKFTNDRLKAFRNALEHHLTVPQKVLLGDVSKAFVDMAAFLEQHPVEMDQKDAEWHLKTYTKNMNEIVQDLKKTYGLDAAHTATNEMERRVLEAIQKWEAEVDNLKYSLLESSPIPRESLVRLQEPGLQLVTEYEGYVWATKAIRGIQQEAGHSRLSLKSDKVLRRERWQVGGSVLGSLATVGVASGGVTYLLTHSKQPNAVVPVASHS
jgi:hypothetical protein